MTDTTDVYVDTTVGELLDGDVILVGFPDTPTVKGLQIIGPVTIIDMQDGTATAPVPTSATVKVRRTLTSGGDWECYRCGFRVPSLTEGFQTRCPRCCSFELHLTDEAKARKQ